MQPMTLITDDGSFDGRGTIGGDVGLRRGRFLGEAEPRSSSCLSGPLAILYDQIVVRVVTTDHRIGGFWGIEASFVEIADSERSHPASTNSNTTKEAEQGGDGDAEEAV